VWITQFSHCKRTTPRKHSPDGATHLVTATSSLLLIIYRPRKAELTLLADIKRTVYPYKWLPISCTSGVAGQGMFAGQRQVLDCGDFAEVSLYGLVYVSLGVMHHYIMPRPTVHPVHCNNP